MPSEPTSAQQPDGGAEDAFDRWIHDDHFGDGCAILLHENTHSDGCVEASFKDGYAAGRRAPIPPASPERPLTIHYTNHCGETSLRNIIPQRLWFGVSRWHPEPQWLLDAHDVDKDSDRTFALSGIGQATSPEREEVYRAVDTYMDAPTFALFADYNEARTRLVNAIDIGRMSARKEDSDDRT